MDSIRNKKPETRVVVKKEKWVKIKTVAWTLLVIAIAGMWVHVAYTYINLLEDLETPVIQELYLIEPTIPVIPEDEPLEGYEIYDDVITEVTAYSPRVIENDDTPRITANGDTVYEGGIACPRHIKFGTKVMIDDEIYTCNDRMALKNDGKYDIFFEDTQMALNFGRQEKVVTIYKKV